MPTDEWNDILTAGKASLLHVRGEQDFATLAARGAALETVDAAVYLRAQADAVLREN